MDERVKEDVTYYFQLHISQLYGIVGIFAVFELICIYINSQKSRKPFGRRTYGYFIPILIFITALWQVLMTYYLDFYN